MNRITGNIFEHVFSESPQYTTIVIPTNGCWTRAGAVMGAGLALQMRQWFPDLPLLLKKRLETQKALFEDSLSAPQRYEPWNVPYILKTLENNVKLMSFPTKAGETIVREEKEILPRYCKKYKKGDVIEGWKLRSSLFLIGRSAEFVARYLEERPDDSVLLPKVGTGEGELNWDAVEEVLESHFDSQNNVTIITLS